MKKKSSFLWNTIGSIIYSGSSFVLLIMVTRNIDESQAGIYSIAFSIAQLMLSIGRYGMRPFQATDIYEKYSFGEYVVSRIITCVIMILSGMTYGLLFAFNEYKLQALIWLCVLKMADAVEDVFHGYMQQKEKLDLAGKLLACRNLFTIILFSVVICLSKDLLYTCRSVAIMSLLVAILINSIFIIGDDKNIGEVKIRKVMALLKECVGLFLAMFLIQYIYNAPKMAIDMYLTAEKQTSYGVLFMISFILSIFCEFLFRPMLTVLAKYWYEKAKRQFEKNVFGMLGIIGLVGVIIEAFFVNIIVELLSWVYKIELMEYIYEFRVLMAGGIISAAVYYLYNVLTAIRNSNIVFISYSVSAICSLVIPFSLTKRYGMMGASVSYLLAMIIIFTGLLCGVIRSCYRIQEEISVGKENK